MEKEKIDRINELGRLMKERELTDAEKAAALSWLGAVGTTDYASADAAGVVKVGNGLTVNPKTNALGIVGATESQISDKLSNQQAITPANLDFAVKTSVTTNTIELTADEQEAAQKWIGVKKATNEAKPYTFVERSANGVIYTGTPTENKHATTKEYVDAAIAALKAELLGG